MGRSISRGARASDCLGTVHAEHDIPQIVSELNRLRRAHGRDREPFDILLQCPQAVSIDDIRRIEDLGVTELWVTPWLASIPPGEEAGVAATFCPQPTLERKLDAIKEYGERIIAKFR